MIIFNHFKIKDNLVILFFLDLNIIFNLSHSSNHSQTLTNITLNLEMSKQVNRPDPTRPTRSWWFSEPTQPDSLFNEPKKFEPDRAHHGLAG